ncbi:MAG: hypothetical protein JSU58_06925 [Dehalococcoidales bacterium]|nr:MAG: hypothetical protein JSU58_06925 [Dehalococcoidales bacterium]
MASENGDKIDPHPETSENNEVIRKLRQDITAGKHWYLALLEAVKNWNATEETVNDLTWNYLISGEAFDWLLLAERISDSVSNLIPEPEITSLLFHNNPPMELSPDEFKERIGETKYGQHLNYYYGITVEEALQTAVDEEIRKERWTSGYYRDKDNVHEVYRRIYGQNRTVMLKRFRKEKGYSDNKSIRLKELKEFTYWLFKYRLKQNDKARVASDTRKGLDWLENRRNSKRSHDLIHPQPLDILSY